MIEIRAGHYAVGAGCGEQGLGVRQPPCAFLRDGDVHGAVLTGAAWGAVKSGSISSSGEDQ